MMTPEPLYRMMVIDSSEIIAPREDYQRELKSERVKRIVSNFDERIANEPKVSYRDGKYYVFDGQHTIDARKALNGGNDLPILCKVYMGMSEKEEALLFARQTGESARLTPGVRVRAEIFGEDGNAVVFLKANADLGIELDYDQERGHMRIGCIKTAMNAYRRLGEERYKEAMGIIVSAWGGEPDSFRRENIIGITRFVDRYHDSYIPQRLITRLSNVDPLTIPREGRAVGVDIAGYKKVSLSGMENLQRQRKEVFAPEKILIYPPMWRPCSAVAFTYPKLECRKELSL